MAFIITQRHRRKWRKSNKIGYSVVNPQKDAPERSKAAQHPCTPAETDVGCNYWSVNLN
jgi:hypothetical protein